ncbi:alkaline phosphatase family protein [Natranaerobius trueperi]|uniref:Metalloenzyme domain-containing protein n=1 Tax=Natranaerobius trueperi TaxID=759412 RepID=A0A226BZR5_9FIRM|nr:alkaline phosphatase family protein [Natranaerobius trueperi]OWZ83834.1 hypothetical protein CDO51_06255 [Natranaerobius trueperi]
MKQIYIVFVLAIVGLVAMTGCVDDASTKEGGDSSPDSSSSLPMKIVGDVDEPVTIEQLSDISETETIEHREEDLEVISLQDLLYKSQPYTKDMQTVFISHDGFSAEISSEDLSESYIARTQENGWEAINYNHPVSSNIKDISHIVVSSNDLCLEDGFNIIEPEKNITSLSPGQIYQDGYSVVPTYRGSSSVKNDEKELEVSTFNRRKIIDIEKYVNLSGREEIIIVGEQGEIEPLRQDGKFILNKNSIGYMAGDDIYIDQAAGIVLDPPDKMITDAYHDTKELLAQDEQVLLILIDGLGYHQYEYAVDNGYAPFLESLPKPEQAMVAYPPVTPVNVAASLTGELPYINGVYERGIRRVDVPTIFGYCEDHGKESAAIIGPMETIELEIDPVFSLDQNNDGSTDGKKRENALSKMSQEKVHDLMFVHYKDVDRIGHNHGNMAKETMEAIAYNDELVKELVTHWDGKVIVYADHGMHETEDGGDHNSVMTEDMFMPYWQFDGGEIDE